MTSVGPARCSVDQSTEAPFRRAQLPQLRAEGRGGAFPVDVWVRRRRPVRHAGDGGASGIRPDTNRLLPSPFRVPLRSNSRSTGYTVTVPVQSLRPDLLEEQLDKLDEVREPPVPVTAWLLLDERNWDGELLGWAANPNGADDGWCGLVRLTREYAPGFWAEGVFWVRAERINLRG
jgi:hypothetical protein